MAVSLIQTKTGNAGNYENFNVQTLPAAVAAGNALILGVAAGSEDSIANITDNRGNAWVLAANVQNGERQGWIYYVKNAAAGSTTVTINFGANQYPDSAVIVREYSGLDQTSPLDRTASAVDTDYVQNHPAGTTAATVAANELVVVFSGVSDQTPGWTAGTGYGNAVSQAGYDLYSSAAMADKQVAATGAQTGTFTTSKFVKGFGIVVTFKAAVTSFQGVKTQAATASIMPDKMYYYGTAASLPADASPLTPYSPAEVSSVSAADGSYAVLTQTSAYGIHMFFNRSSDPNAGFSPSWTGKIPVAASVRPVVMQVWNNVSSAWETVATDTAAPANGTVSLNAAVTANLSAYRDANGYRKVRVYQ